MIHRLRRTAATSLLLTSLSLLTNTAFAQAAPAPPIPPGPAHSQELPAVADPCATAMPLECAEPAPASRRASKRGRRVGIAVGVTLGTLLLLGAGFAIGLTVVARASGGFSPEIDF